MALNSEKRPELDETDRKILRELQRDATQTMDRLAGKCGLSKTACWNRVQRLQESGVIRRQVAIVDADKVGLAETFFVAIKTNQHDEKWLHRFGAVIAAHPEIVEAHRLAGETDYLLKVQVATTRDFDRLYQEIVADIDIYSVTSSLSMEVLKQVTSLPL